MPGRRESRSTTPTPTASPPQRRRPVPTPAACAPRPAPRRCRGRRPGRSPASGRAAGRRVPGHRRVVGVAGGDDARRGTPAASPAGPRPGPRGAGAPGGRARRRTRRRAGRGRRRRRRANSTSSTPAPACSRACSSGPADGSIPSTRPGATRRAMSTVIVPGRTRRRARCCRGGGAFDVGGGVRDGARRVGAQNAGSMAVGVGLVIGAHAGMVRAVSQHAQQFSRDMRR